MRHIAVLDIGKTNAKVLLIDLATGGELKVFKTANRVLQSPPYPHYDIEALWSFLGESLKELAKGPVDAISITTHGACAALVDEAGDLVLPVLDYELRAPGEDAAYGMLRPPFAETGSPRLPMGLNLGAQLWWLEETYPADFAEAALCLMYPQFWAMRLTGVAASEATSLGCHTDLWRPWEARFSSLVEGQGWAHLFPGLAKASDHAPLRPELAAAWGLPKGLPVHFGLHDSNASLLPYLAEEGPCSVVSSGTWTICMALGGRRVALDARRDVLINVNARGEPVPTARFMGGREFDEITEGAVVEGATGPVFVPLPSRHPECGPFPGILQGPLPAMSAAERTRSASWYAGLMTAECLRLIGAEGPTHVEGPFGGNRDYAEMLATATGRPVIAAGRSAGTGLGAAMLAGPVLAPRPQGQAVAPVAALLPVAAEWRARVNEVWTTT